ncbi:hypothetical protein NWF34_18045 [Gordonia sp. GONU]|uniref:hypothetical protein n=1 Tax=Gordonia TaxID=2053 RepID=UPI0021AC8929|nr:MULTISPECIES: hypothetical protein [Gordonia]MCR8898852.1 hypothetical protein [Gordonia sp. GONU]MCZ4650515.1 hypothetical protein [Gordonia amicalis]
MAALVFGSVRTTGALWVEEAEVSDATITTGTIGLAPGSGSAPTFTFPALNGANVAPGDSRQAVLNIVNTGSTPLRFKLATAGPTVQTAGATVTVNLSGASAGTCPGTSVSLEGAFPAQNTTGAGTGFDSPWTPLAVGATTTWCIRSRLVSVNGTQPATFTIAFNFAAEQTRP